MPKGKYMAKAELLFVATTSGIITLSNPGGIGRWLKAGHSLTTHAITCVWCNPSDPTHVLCGDGSQLWQSHDGAQTWHPLAGPACRTLIASRTAPTRIMGHDGQHAWLSDDAGASWRQLGVAMRIGMAGDVVWYDQQLSRDGGQTWHPHAPQCVGISSDSHTMLTTTDDVTVWSLANQPIPAPAVACQSWAVCGGQPWTCLGVHAGTVWRYQDAWQMQTQITAHIVYASIYHPDHVWAASHAGAVWLSSDRGQTWQDVRQGLLPITALVNARLL